MSLEQLKMIRKQRMERTYVELQASKSQLKICEDAVYQGKIKLEEFHHWRLEHQETLFTNLQTADFSPDDLQRYMAKLEELKEEEVALEEKIPQLESALDVAKTTLSRLRRKLVNINRDLEKVNEFIDMEKEERRLIEGKKEEDATDELASFRATKH